LLQRKGGGGFTKVYTLSPALAAVVGSETMARHDVVKKMWAIIKERNLYVSIDDFSHKDSFCQILRLHVLFAGSQEQTVCHL